MSHSLPTRRVMLPKVGPPSHEHPRFHDHARIRSRGQVTDAVGGLTALLASGETTAVGLV
jgi:hypothetical protein